MKKRINYKLRNSDDFLRVYTPTSFLSVHST